MMTSQILKSVDFAKTQKSRYLENETSFFFLKKKFINYTSMATLWQKNSFVAGVTFNMRLVSLPPQQWPKVGCGPAKLELRKSMQPY